VTTPVIVVEDAALRRIVAEAIAPLVAELTAIRAAQLAPTSPLMGPDEFAKLLDVHPRTLHRMELAGDIPAAIRIGPKTVRWRRDMVDEFLRTGRVDSAPKTLSIRRSRG
jgi:predicted DNA-binding transcriptional regulator AlpA